MDASEMASMMSGMSDMSGMGMDSGSGGIFLAFNQLLARIYWYVIAALLGLVCLLKGLRAMEVSHRSVSSMLMFQYQRLSHVRCLAIFLEVSRKVLTTSTSFRKRTARALSISHPTRPRNFLTQAYATTVAITREIAYSQTICFSHSWWEWLSPPPLGQSLVVVAYMAVITLFLTTGSIVFDAYYWERMGFRAAWVSVTQVPLVFLLGGKINIVSLLLGSSYVDVNWLHRWVSRTLFVTVTIHGSFFLREWVQADFVQTELAMMPMVKYGLGLWGVLAWINISSLLPLRRLCYEFFVIQHLLSAVIFLWLLSVHVPAYAAYNLWMAVAFLLLGRAIRGCSLVYRNVMIKKSLLDTTARKPVVGYSAELQAMPGHITVLTIHEVSFSWKAGQHILLWCPSFGPLEAHPFTISNVPRGDRKDGSRKLELMIRARSGFTRRLNRRAISSQATMTTFVTGPFGNLPTWNSFETLVLISASTGASFILPILQSVLDEPCCVRRIDCLILVRRRTHVHAYLPHLRDILLHPRSSEVSLQITVAITGEEGQLDKEYDALSSIEGLSSASRLSQISSDGIFEPRKTASLASAPENQKVIIDSEKGQMREIKLQPIGFVNTRTCSSDRVGELGSLRVSSGRANIAEFITEPVEASAGETSVVVCGGKSLSSTVRNCVASLSDDRAVHKGTGAQGIHLHVEGFGL